MEKTYKVDFEKIGKMVCETTPNVIGKVPKELGGQFFHWTKW